MNTERAQVGWGFWLWWVLVSSVGFAVGLVPGLGGGFKVGSGGMGFDISLLLDIAGAILSIAVLGAAVGIAQWFVLRREVSWSGWWILASTVGFVVAAVFVKSVQVQETVAEAVEAAESGGALASAVSDAVEDAVVDVVEEALEDLAEAVEDAVGGVSASAVEEALSDALEEDLGEAVTSAVEEATGGGDVVSDVEDEVIGFVEETVEDAIDETGVGRTVSDTVEEVVSEALEEALGEAVASAVDEVGGGALDDTMGDAVGDAAGLAVFGAAVGIAQWFVLQREFSRSGWWILASTVGFTVAAVYVLAAPKDAALFIGMGSVDAVDAVDAVDLVLSFAVYGAITGGVMVWLLRQPVTQEPSLPQRGIEIPIIEWKPLRTGLALGIVIGIAFMVGWFAFSMLLPVYAGLALASLVFLTIRRKWSAFWAGVLLGAVITPVVLFGLFVLLMARSGF